MTITLAPWHVGYEKHLVGSVYAAAPGLRTQAAEALVAAGIAVHVDVMAPDEGLPVGVTLDELDELAAIVPRDMLGVHLVGSVDGVRAMLPRIPDVGDLYVPLGTPGIGSSRVWAAVWDEVDEASASTVDLTGYDGVLLMLLEPGTSGVADPDRLSIATALARRIDVTLDGGVTEHLMPACLSTGASTAVVGRALILDSPLPEGHS
ncbi:hypothetical protein [Rhodococcoides kyotonense]|uniref:Ribulose-phosphate 3-epimerase n=1 Tax=Rhodococcoides kyotonense TaxID=398843 RepID=A0A177Y8Z9_9NOCA|nr:hypothetical protein [Rhodococcus kyotonensis]OAK51679.1 hypothetical protein A3K89_10355 [Rhodococcus kyotonensis]